MTINPLCQSLVKSKKKREKSKKKNRSKKKKKNKNKNGLKELKPHKKRPTNRLKYSQMKKGSKTKKI